MRWTTLGAVLLGGTCVDAVGLFPRAKAGKGYLSVPVGTVDRPRKTTKRQDGSIVTTLENMDFFYATDSEWEMVEEDDLLC